MKKTDHETRLRVANTQGKPIRLVLEPWGREYVVRPTDEYILVFLGPGKSEPEVLVGQDEIEVWGWTGTTVDVFKNGEELTEYVPEDLPTVTSK
jgi:hypothetical protein